MDPADDASRLRDLLTRFGESPADPSLPALARDLATRHTLDQLEAMSQPDTRLLRELFDRFLGRAGL